MIPIGEGATGPDRRRTTRTTLTMVGQIVHAPAQQSPFCDAFARIREELDVPDAFPDDALAEAAAVAHAGPSGPAGGRRDVTHATFRS